MTEEKLKQRSEHFAPGGVPKNINVYDNGGETADRYTCTFKGLRIRSFPYLSMSEHPFHPQGVGMHGEHTRRIDYPRYSHLGKPVNFKDLPHDVQVLIWIDYADYWGIPIPEEYQKPDVYVTGYPE